MDAKSSEALAAHVRDIAQAYLDGKDIQFRDILNGDEWYTTLTPHFDFKAHEYRVKPAKTTYVPWDKVDPVWKWARTRPDRRVVLYKEHPATMPSEMLVLPEPVMRAFGIKPACRALALGAREDTIVYRYNREGKKDV